MHIHRINAIAAKPSGVPAPPPEIRKLVLPASIKVRDLAVALGCKLFVLNRELIPMGVFAGPTTELDFATAAQLCARFGVNAQMA